MRELASKRGWIFDMDGTLTEAVHDFTAMKRMLEVPADSGILEFLDALPPAQREAKYGILNDLEWDLAHRGKSAPGAEALLSHLAGRGLFIGIVTRNNFVNAGATLAAAGLKKFIDDENIMSRDHCRPKPDPHGLEILLHRWGISGVESVMVGDFRDDMKAGRQAGTTCIFADFNRSGLWSDLADHTVHDLTDLIQ